MLPAHDLSHNNFSHCVPTHPTFSPSQQLKGIASAILLSNLQTFYDAKNTLNHDIVYHTIGNKSTNIIFYPCHFLPTQEELILKKRLNIASYKAISSPTYSYLPNQFILFSLPHNANAFLFGGSSILSMNHRTILFSLVTSRGTSLPPERRHRFTLLKNACGSG